MSSVCPIFPFLLVLAARLSHGLIGVAGAMNDVYGNLDMKD